MALLKTNNPLTADGDYDIDNLQVGTEYLLLMKGDFDGASLVLQAWSPAAAAYVDVDDAYWDGAGDTEARFVAPDPVCRLVLEGAGGSTSIAISLCARTH